MLSKIDLNINYVEFFELIFVSMGAETTRLGSSLRQKTFAAGHWLAAKWSWDKPRRCTTSTGTVGTLRLLLWHINKSPFPWFPCLTHDITCHVAVGWKIFPDLDVDSWIFLPKPIIPCWNGTEEHNEPCIETILWTKKAGMTCHVISLAGWQRCSKLKERRWKPKNSKREWTLTAHQLHSHGVSLRNLWTTESCKDLPGDIPKDMIMSLDWSNLQLKSLIGFIESTGARNNSLSWEELSSSMARCFRDWL